MPDITAELLSVGCPFCGAKEGQECLNFLNMPMVIKVHPERQDALVKSQKRPFLSSMFKRK